MYKNILFLQFLILSLLKSQSIQDRINQGVIPSLDALPESVLNDAESLTDLIKEEEQNNFNSEPIFENNQDFLSSDSLLDSTIIRQETLNLIKDKKSDEIEEEIATIDSLDYYFGYDVFKSSPAVKLNNSFESVDPGYVIGPGDEIIIMLWGETEINKKYKVSRDGYLFIPNLGQIFVNSLTLDKLEIKLKKQLKKIYSSLDPVDGNPTTFFDVSLGPSALRPLKIFVLGEVANPGVYHVNSTATLFSSLYFFKGPTTNGSLRNVQLIREEKVIENVDIYQYLMTGIKDRDQQLQRGDVIFFPTRGKTIKVQGEINRNKFFELKEEETLIDVIEFAGGLKNTTYKSRTQINRVIPYDELSNVNVNVRKIDVDLISVLSKKKSEKMYDGDVITFYKINKKFENTVSIIGNVNRPGIFALEENMDVSKLIKKADGLRGDTYMGTAEIVRTNQDSTKSYININLDSAILNDSLHNIQLINNDILTIYNKISMLHLSGVQINGHVKNPGFKPYLEGMNLFDLVFQGGGFKNELHLKNTYFERAELITSDPSGQVRDIISFRLDSVLVGKGLASYKINMGDEVRIYSNDEVYGETINSIEINGNVLRPGSYRIPESSLFSDILFRAGGLDNQKHKSSVYMSRADIIRTNKDDQSKKIIKVNINSVLDPSNNYDPIILPDDKIIIHSKEMFYDTKEVGIYGIINNPGDYFVKKDMTLLDLIFEAGGVSSDIESFIAEVVRPPKNDRTNLNAKKSQIFKRKFYNKEKSFDLTSTNKLSANSVPFILHPNDYIILRPDLISNQEFVSISGYVNYPGNYVITSPNETVTDIIDRAGGLRPEAFPDASNFLRGGELVQLSFKTIIRYPNSKYNFIVLDGDSIQINAKTNIVKVEGAVNSPGSYQYMKGKKFNDYVEMAGGYTENASIYKAYVRYPNGSAKTNKFLKLSSPNILDSSIIIVPDKIESAPFSFTDYVTDLTAIYTDMMQAYMILVLLGNQNQ